MEESILMWNRLEGSLRNENQLDNALRFEIRDALWMLTRQWQFGELDGEDAGSAAFANIDSEQYRITGIGRMGAYLPFNILNSTIEQAIESENFNPDVATRIEIGRHWERILKRRLAASEALQAIQKFRANSRFHFKTGLPAENDRAARFQQAQSYSDADNITLLNAVANGKAIDGMILVNELKSGRTASAFLDATDNTVNAAGNEFLSWFSRVYGQGETINSWNPQHLEYEPAISFAGDGTVNSSLSNPAYYGDGFEWYGLTPHMQASTTPSNPASTGADRKQVTINVIPSGVRFRGMPSVRLWEMEDSQVDFGSIRSSSTELSKMIFAEFGLVYGNDWLIAPLEFNAGSLCRIRGIVVTDTFGKEIHLQEMAPDINWSFFQAPVAADGKRWLFLTNGSDLIQEGKPIEKVSLLRDEMANLVWAVEEVITDPFGGGRDGEALAKKTREFVEYLQAKAAGPSNPSGTVTTDGVTTNETIPLQEGKPLAEGWKYKAGTLMAENRIPFIAMATPPEQMQAMGRRTVSLQRAALPRVGDDFAPVRIRPRTSLMGRKFPSELEKPEPLVIFEEEIPRAGITLSLVWKRARWLDGQTHTWLARKKTVGKGEVDANFRFDTLKKSSTQ